MLQSSFLIRALRIPLIAALVAGTVACGTQTGPAPSGSTPGAAAGAGTKVEQPVELLVSAAASLNDAMKEIESDYKQAHPNVKLTFNFGSSGALQQQIEQGAPADLFLSAGEKQMDALTDKQLVEKSKQIMLLTNELVMVVPADAAKPPATAADLTKADVRKIAIGESETVPAGMYAKQSLVYAKLWDTLQSKFVFAKDVRQVLSYVETGNADAGFVYKTDALISSKVKVAGALDPQSYTPVNYPAAVVKATKHETDAAAFLTYLQSASAKRIFEKYGFKVPGKS